MRLIDADAAVLSARQAEAVCLPDRNGEVLIYARAVGDFIEIRPTVDAEPVKHGHWHFVRTNVYSNIYECSVCGRPILASNLSDFPYCHCGAKMDEEVNREADI